MGSSTCCPAPSTAAQSTLAPRTWTAARAARNRAGPPSSRRSVPVTAGAGVPLPSVVSSRVSVTAAVSTGCGDTSMNTWWPLAARAWTACSNSTGLRRLSYQYPGLPSAPSSHWPVIAEIIGICTGSGVIGSRSARISARSVSTWALCEA